MLSNCVCILLKVNEAFYGFWDYSKFLLLSFRNFFGTQRHFTSKMNINVLPFWVGLWVHTNHKWQDPCYSVYERREMLQSISARLCMYFWSTKWHIKTTRLSVYTETVFSNPCQKKCLKIPFFALWGKIAVLDYEGLSLGVKHSSWHSLHCYREACGSDWGSQ